MPDYTSLNEGQIRSTYNNNRAINEREEIEAKADLDYFNRRINDPIKKTK